MDANVHFTQLACVHDSSICGTSYVITHHPSYVILLILLRHNHPFLLRHNPPFHDIAIYSTCMY